MPSQYQSVLNNGRIRNNHKNTTSATNNVLQLPATILSYFLAYTLTSNIHAVMMIIVLFISIMILPTYGFNHHSMFVIQSHRHRVYRCNDRYWKTNFCEIIRHCRHRDFGCNKYGFDGVKLHAAVEADDASNTVDVENGVKLATFVHNHTMGLNENGRKTNCKGFSNGLMHQTEQSLKKNIQRRFSTRNRKNTSTMNSTTDTLYPYRANVIASKKTQARIETMFHECKKGFSSSQNIEDYSSSIKVLNVLLEADPYHEVNTMNILFALGSSVKLLPSTETAADSLTKDLSKSRSIYHDRLSSVVKILKSILTEKQDDKGSSIGRYPGLTARQLTNAAWALSKSLSHVKQGSQIHLLIIHVMKEIARSVVYLLNQPVSKKTTGKKSHADSKFSPVELSMTLGAYARLKPRHSPVGWKYSRHHQTKSKDGVEHNNIHFEGLEFSTIPQEDNDHIYDDIFNEIAIEIVSNKHCLRAYSWSAMANILWAFAYRGYQTTSSEALANKISKEATRRLTAIKERKVSNEIPLPRDIATLSWSLGVMQVDNFRLGGAFEHFIATTSLFLQKFDGHNLKRFSSWSCSDIVQLGSSLAHGRVDDKILLELVLTQALNSLETDTFKTWELVVLLCK